MVCRKFGNTIICRELSDNGIYIYYEIFRGEIERSIYPHGSDFWFSSTIQKAIKDEIANTLKIDKQLFIDLIEKEFENEN